MARPKLGRIERLGHDHYRVQWSAGYRPDGKRNRLSKTLHCTRREAEAFLARQIGFGGRQPSSVTWGEFWAVYMGTEGLAKRTQDDYAKLWAILAPHIASMLVSETDELAVDTVLSQISSPSTQRHVKDLWRKACRVAVRRKLLDRCPIDSSTPLKPLKRRARRLLDASEVAGWMEGIHGLKHELALLAMLGGGLRPEEAYGLHFSDIAEWEGYALVQVSRALTYSNGKVLKEPKNGFSVREVVVGEPFASRMLAFQGEGPICPSGHGKGTEAYTSPSVVCRNYKGWCERKGIVYVAPKDLRASYATMHGEAGSPDSLVSGSMGHSDGTTKGRHYQRITRRGLALIADNLAEFLASF